jgi:hypothetical protein
MIDLDDYYRKYAAMFFISENNWTSARVGDSIWGIVLSEKGANYITLTHNGASVRLKLNDAKNIRLVDLDKLAEFILEAKGNPA